MRIHWRFNNDRFKNVSESIVVFKNVSECIVVTFAEYIFIIAHTRRDSELLLSCWSDRFYFEELLFLLLLIHRNWELSFISCRFCFHSVCFVPFLRFCLDHILEKVNNLLQLFGEKMIFHCTTNEKAEINLAQSQPSQIEINLFSG